MPNSEEPTLPIALGIRDLGKKAGTRLLEIVRTVIRDSGKQESIARALGVSDALLSQALNGQRTFNLCWLPALLPYDHERRILKYLAWESYCRVEPIDPFTDADYRKAAEDVLRAAGPLGDVLRQQILGSAQQHAEERSHEK